VAKKGITTSRTVTLATQKILVPGPYSLVTKTGGVQVMAMPGGRQLRLEKAKTRLHQVYRSELFTRNKGEGLL